MPKKLTHLPLLKFNSPRIIFIPKEKERMITFNWKKYNEKCAQRIYLIKLR